MESREIPEALDALATEYLERCRRGETPDLSEFVAKSPQLADEIRSLFPTLQLMEAARRTSPEPETADIVSRKPADSELIGNYRLLQQIGEGGMGTVYLAQQLVPVKRQVALKLIKPGMDSRQIIARFEAERQALAVMDHPNIAKVLDGGLHDGRLYFVMELVKGVPITEYCNAQRLTPRERLELFVPVCHAIQHAHQKGIIHRDIKPSNVLVAPYDDRPVPKVIDFGLAKATGVSLLDPSCATNFGGVVGTPQYMSPEQASLNNLDIDTRTDIYSLGTLLYELLTGSPPFSKRDLDQAGMLEVLRVIREVDPPRPSTRLSTAEGLPSLSAERGMEPARLMGLLRNELDWIVMKALEKDRSRRYETANGFAADIQQFLAGEPVSAHPPSAVYRLRKIVRKHRVLVSAASLVFLTLIAGIIGTGIGLYQANLARDDAEEAARRESRERSNAEKARGEAVTAREQAEKRRIDAENNLAFARKGNAILGSVFSGLDPHAEYATIAELRNALRDNLHRAIADLEGSAIGDPLEVTEMQVTLGNALLALGQFEQSTEVFEKALKTRTELLGPQHPSTLSVASDLAGSYSFQGDLKTALPLFEKTLALQRTDPGNRHVETLGTMNDLALTYARAGQPEKALPLIKEALEIRRSDLGQNHIDTLASMASLADHFIEAGKVREAMPLLKEVHELSRTSLGADHPRTLSSANALAEGHRRNGDPRKAVELFEATLAARKARLGPEHPDTLVSMGNLGSAYLDVDEQEKSIELLERTYRLMNSELGPDHPHTLTGLSLLSSAYYRSRLPEKALPLMQETFARTQAKLGLEHPHTLISNLNLASAYEEAGDLQKATQIYEEVLPLVRQILGAEHSTTAPGIKGLADCYLAMGETDKALSLYQEALDLTEARLGPDHPETLVMSNALSRCFVDLGQPEKAIPLLEGALRIQKTSLGSDHSTTLGTMERLAHALIAVGKSQEALELFQNAYATRVSKFGPDHPDTKASLNNLAVGLKVTGNIREALPCFAQVYDWVKVHKGRDHPDTLNALYNLSNCYYSAGDLARALPLMDELVALRKSKLGIGHPDTLKAMNELGAGYGLSGRTDEGIKLLEETLELMKSELGPEHDLTLDCMSNLTGGYSATGQFERAIALSESLLEVRKNRYGPDHAETIGSMSNLAALYLASGDKQKGMPLLEAAVNQQIARLGSSHTDTLYSINYLANMYMSELQFDKAIALYEPAATAIEEAAFLNPHASSIIPGTIRAYDRVQNFAQADLWRNKWMSYLEATSGKTSPAYAGELAAYGLSLLLRGSAPEAEKVLRECLTIREKSEPDAWTTFNTHSALGESLLAQKRFDEAEPMLLMGYEGMKQRETTIPPFARIRLIESLERLVRLYTEWNKPGQASAWKAKLADAQSSPD